MVPMTAPIGPKISPPATAPLTPPAVPPTAAPASLWADAAPAVRMRTDNEVRINFFILGILLV